jgi:hypothetical protein
MMMRKLLLGIALCGALGLPLSAEIALAKAGDASCRLTAATGQLKPLRSTVVVENAVNPSGERISRRVNYTPAPSVAHGKDQASYLVYLERQSKPASLLVGVGF